MKSHELKIYNSLTRQKEIFKPLQEGHIGLYVCGPTVYNNVHLGNCRTFVNFDLIYRYLLHLGYKVRYVRNITDAGHLVGDVDEGAEDKIGRMARLEQIEPMEIVQRYTLDFKDKMQKLNTLAPSIEPTATGHIVEQIEMVQEILDKGFAYERNGSVYFKTVEFAQKYPYYGQLSGKKLEDLLETTRELNKQDEKDHPADFALWVKAPKEHLMRWNSPWGEGFPGWHLECSVMSTKYLGEKFDIHGGGMDLQFPHHENEIAQNVGCCGVAPVQYWMHANMLNMNGQKMSKSLGNSVEPDELFNGTNKLLSKAYSPMIVRFLFLQSHYRSVSDLSDSALLAAEKGYRRLMEANRNLEALHAGGSSSGEHDKHIRHLIKEAFAHMDDDFNAPRALASLFELATEINKMKSGDIDLKHISGDTMESLKNTYHAFIFDIFGLKDETHGGGGNGEAGVVDGLMDLVIALRAKARDNKDWGTSDQIRDTLQKLQIQLKDGKDGTSWTRQ